MVSTVPRCYFFKQGIDEKVEASNCTCIARMECSLSDCDSPNLLQDIAKPCSWHTTGEPPRRDLDDASTRFLEAVPLQNIRIFKIAWRNWSSFYTLWSSLFRSVRSRFQFYIWYLSWGMFQLGVKLMKSSAYHPKSQGALEIFHQTLKSMIWAYCFQEKKDWEEGISLILFSMREAIQTSLGFIPFELVFGHTLVVHWSYWKKFG